LDSKKAESITLKQARIWIEVWTAAIILVIEQS
jgi:hypothetical protein